MIILRSIFLLILGMISYTILQYFGYDLDDWQLWVSLFAIGFIVEWFFGDKIFQRKK